MKRTLALLTAAVMLLPVTGCSKKPKGATLQIDLTTSYASAEFDDDGVQYQPAAVTEKGVICERYHALKETYLALCDPDTGEWRKIHKNQPNLPDWEGLLPDGRLAAVYNVVLGVGSGVYNYDGKQRIMEIYDDDLNVAEERPLPDAFPESILHEWNFTADSAGNWYFLPVNDEYMTNTVEVYDPDFTKKCEIPLDDANIVEMAVGRSGAVYLLTSHAFFRLHADTRTAEKLDGMQPTHIASGPDYELYGSNATGIYGLSEDMTPTLITDFRNSDLPDDVYRFWVLRDGNFLINYNNSNSPRILRLRPRTEEELTSVKVLSLAGVNLKKQLVHNVCDFNRSQTEVHILMKDYADVYRMQETWEDDWQFLDEAYNADPYSYYTIQAQRYPEALEAFENDLLSGIVPDIICMDSLPYQQLSNKGLLADLAPMLEQDERFDPADYYMNYIDGLKSGEKLERIGFSFTVDTAAAKTELIGAQQGRTPAEYTDMIRNLPEGMDLLNNPTREAVTSLYLTGSQSSFINRGTMTCSFDSDSFVQLLELANSVKPASELTYSDEELQEQADLGYAYWEKHRLLTPFTLFAPYHYHSVHTADYRNADITLVGFPESALGNGGRYRMNYILSMTAQSAMQQEVWEYFMWELAPRQQGKVGISSNSMEQAMPLQREAFENYLKAANIATPMHSAASAEEMDLVREYIAGVRMYAENDPAISAIITEEAEKFFSGDQTAKQAADVIQSRCTLYLSEQQ